MELAERLTMGAYILAALAVSVLALLCIASMRLLKSLGARIRRIEARMESLSASVIKGRENGLKVFQRLNNLTQRTENLERKFPNRIHRNESKNQEAQ